MIGNDITSILKKQQKRGGITESVVHLELTYKGNCLLMYLGITSSFSVLQVKFQYINIAQTLARDYSELLLATAACAHQPKENSIQHSYGSFVVPLKKD